MENLKMFLKELSALTKKYGIKICGCGCCGSPWVEDINTKDMLDNLSYNAKKELYEVDGV